MKEKCLKITLEYENHSVIYEGDDAEWANEEINDMTLYCANHGYEWPEDLTGRTVPK